MPILVGIRAVHSHLFGIRGSEQDASDVYDNWPSCNINFIRSSYYENHLSDLEIVHQLDVQQKWLIIHDFEVDRSLARFQS